MKRRLLALLVIAGLPALPSSQEGDTPKGADKQQRARVERRADRQARNKTDAESSESRRKAEARSQDRQERVKSRVGTQDVATDRVARAQRDAQRDDGAERTATGGPQPPKPKSEPQDTARTQRDKEQDEPARDRESNLKPPVEGVRQTDRPADRPQDRSETDAPKLPERVDARRQPTADVADRADIPKKLELEERKHRERLAKIARLRALALEKNQTERLRALEELERKENERFQRYRQDARASLGDRDFDEIDRRLSHGRGHGVVHDVRSRDAKSDKADKEADKHADGERRQDAERRPEDKPKKDKP